MADDGAMIRFDGVTLEGPRGEIVREVSFALPRGGFGVLLGPTGGGKTTILRLAHFERRPDAGVVQVGDIRSDAMDARHLPEARRRIGMVFQDFRLLSDRPALANIELALALSGVPARQTRRRATDLLAQVGLAAKRNMRPQLMSGGEQQRLGIARALANDPHVLLADEPTGNLDREAAGEIMNLIQRIGHRGTTILLATHDLEFVRGYGYPCWHVEQGRLGAVGSL